jgi:hypothetical protein
MKKDRLQSERPITFSPHLHSMTLDTFKSKIKKYRQCEMISFGILFLGVCLGCIPCGVLEDRADQIGLGVYIVVALLSALIIGAVIYYGVVCFPQRCRRQLGLICLKCGKPLTVKHRRQLAVMRTGCCYSCGAKVIDSTT